MKNSRKRSVSAGFVIRGQDGRYLLGKTTKYPKAECWTVFKGQQEDGESLIQTATRELKEESGIDILRSKKLQLSQSTSPFFTFSMTTKDVVLYLLNDRENVLENQRLYCKSHWRNSPEISDYKWCTLDEMEKIIFPSQRGLVEHLRKVDKHLNY